MKKLRVLLANNRALVIAGVKQLLMHEASLEVIGEVNSGPLLRRRLRKNPPDILALDYLNLDNFSAEDCQRLLREYADLRVVIISSDQQRDRIVEILSYGVLGFVTQHCSAQEIVSTFLAAADGKKFFCSAVLNRLTPRLGEAQENASPDLTDKETQIIRLIAQDLSTHEIAHQLHLSPHTINTYRKRLLKKLRVKSPVALVMKAIHLQIIDPYHYH